MTCDKNTYKFFDNLFDNDLYLQQSYDENDYLKQGNFIKSMSIFLLTILATMFFIYVTMSSLEASGCIVNSHHEIICGILIYLGFIAAEYLVSELYGGNKHLASTFLALATALIATGFGLLSFYLSTPTVYLYLIMNLLLIYYLLHKVNNMDTKIPFAILAINSLCYFYLIISNPYITIIQKTLLVAVTLIGVHLNSFCTKYVIKNHINKIIEENKYSYQNVFPILSVLLLMPVYCWCNYAYYFLNTYDEKRT